MLPFMERGFLNGFRRFLNLPVEESYTGAVVTPKSVTVVDLERKESGFYLGGFGRENPPNGESFGERGAAAALNRICRKSSLWTKTVSHLAPGGKTFVRQMQMPPMDKEEIIDSVRYTERDSIPFPVDTASIDAWQAPDKNLPGRINSLVAALDSASLNRQRKIFDRTYFKQVAISIVPAALAAVIGQSKIIDSSLAVPIVAIGDSTASVYVYLHGQIKFSRDINLGGATAPDLRQPVLDRLAMEIGRSLDYFKNEQRIKELPAVYIIGAAASVKQTAGYLAKSLEYDFKVYNPFDDFITIEKERLEYVRELGPEITIPVGLALDRGRTINLLPKRFRYTYKGFVKRFTAVTAVACYLIFLSLVKFAGLGQLGVMQEQVTGFGEVARSLKTEERATVIVVNEIFNIKEKVRTLEKQMASYPALKGSGINWPAVYSEIGSLLPGDIALNTIGVSFTNRPEYAADGKVYSKQVVLRGKVRGKSDNSLKALRLYMERVQDSRLFEHASLISTRRTDKKGSASMLMFTMAADIRDRP